VREVLAEFLGRPSSGYFGVNKALENLKQRNYWLHSGRKVEKWYQK
jgi:hypothetical protein